MSPVQVNTSEQYEESLLINDLIALITDDISAMKHNAT